MQKLLLKNIKSLVSVYDNAPTKLSGKLMKQLPCIENAWLACEDGRIVAYGDMVNFPGITDWKELEVIDCSGKLVFPSFADSHTHIVYSGNREKEFVDRLHGLTYEEIANRGGGILNSAAMLREMDEETLFEQSRERLKEVILQGTGAIEIKSGYGLDIDSELKMLRVIKRLKQLNWIPVKATFLGAHAIPKEYKENKQAYMDVIIQNMLPAIHDEKLADYIDVFCEKGYFDAEETKQILEAGLKFGLRAKVHAEQLSHSNGIQTAVACKAISVDHLEYCNDEDIKVLLASETMPTILPGAALFLNLPLPPARKMIDAGLPVAFASDFNPGSSPTGNMKLMMSLACIQYKLSPEEAFNSVTLNTAFAMDLSHEVGTITVGKRANLIISKNLNGYSSLAYAFGSNHIDTIVLDGKVWTGES